MPERAPAEEQRYQHAGRAGQTPSTDLTRRMPLASGGAPALRNWYLFQDAVEAAKVSWPQEFIINRGVYVSDSEADAKAMLPHAVWHTRTARGLSSNSLPVNAGRAMTELTARLAQEDAPEFLYKDWFFGTPEIVAEKIYRMTQFAGVTYVNCTFNLGQVPHHKVMQSMELLRPRSCPTSATICPIRRSILAKPTPPIPKGTSPGRKGCR
jgi:alkanesulfonate monooxygenase SsuD/methylene tetrahydromethanopterin reductase-like flavin-dependent oxidoreductase (luciferase family)